MKCNVGKTDRMMRIIVGLTIMAVGATMQSMWGFVGVVMLLTGLIRICPAYALIGFTTNR